MLFQDAVFLVFILAVCAIWLPLHRHNTASKAVLLFASYVFYGAWNPHYVWLILASTAIDYVVGLMLGRLPATARVRRRLALLTSIAANLGILGFFKYQFFFVDNVNGLFGTHIPIVATILPVGISFYTFQSMSYTFDVYRGTLPVCRSFLDFATYVSFFPQLVAGPIVRAADFLPQLQEARTCGLRNLSRCLPIFAIGFFKKVILADNLALFVDPVFADLGAHSALDCALALCCYAFQIYYDFSGYTDMAIGVAALFDYRLTMNFNLPYIAVSIADFWRRWHISLSTWLRDYLYIPLGGNRMRSQWGVARNLLITMVLGGLWHGAAWNFVFWGAYQGVALVAERFLLKANERPDTIPFLRLFLIYWPCTMLVTLGGWLLFRVQRLSDVRVFFSSLGHGWSTTTIPHICAVVLAGSVLYTTVRFFQVRLHLSWELPPHPALQFSFGVCRGVFAVLLLILSLLFACGTTTPYIYFQF
jgi:alginate O-acetyltransferase complex protein AlgI